VTRFGLSKNERIKSRKDIQKIYSFGKTITSSNKKFKATFLIQQECAESSVKIIAAVSKKSGNAVWRNRVKRRIKESYRHNKEVLIENCKRKNVRLLVVFSPLSVNQTDNKKISLKEILPNVVELMTTIARSF
jgi:ribonuclease P protein component